MTSSLALGLICAVMAASPEDKPSVNTNAVLARLEDQDPAAFYVAQVPAAGANGAGKPNFNPQNGENGSRRASSGNAYSRLARVPNMFGDSIAANGALQFDPDAFGQITTDPRFKKPFFRKEGTPGPLVSGIPSAGGGRYLPIGENNRPLPTDRVFVTYNGFFNAVKTQNTAGEFSDLNIQRYTFGLEKTFFDKWNSIEVRLPLSNSFNIGDDDFTAAGGNIGNLSLVFKQLLVKTESLAVAIGSGLALPTGSDIDGRFNTHQYQLGNNAVYFSPYLGVSYANDGNFFLTSYVQVDVAASGDEFRIDGDTRGILTSPTFMRFDLSLGYWLLQNTGRAYMSGLAVVSELHYVTSLSNADQFTSFADGSEFTFGYAANRFDFLNTTLGLHWQITDRSNFRVGGVFPLKNSDHRQFDSELQMSFNRLF